MGEVHRKIMGDAPLAFVETVGGVRVGEDDLVTVGKNDVRRELLVKFCLYLLLTVEQILAFKVGRA